jgi:hypothetical protein
MSLKINKDNIFFILTENRYGLSDPIDTDMDNDFTLYTKTKLFPESITNKAAYIIARNGMHSGIAVFKDPEDKIVVQFSYWFYEPSDVDKINPIYKDVAVLLDDTLISEFNHYTMICNDNKKTIDCYINDELVGLIYYLDLDKASYKNTFYWFGCGNMISNDEHSSFGEFEYDLAFLSTNILNINEVIDISNNYNKNIIELVGDLNILDETIQQKHPFSFFCNFKALNRYKIWDLSFKGNNPQLYMENNIYF